MNISIPPNSLIILLEDTTLPIISSTYNTSTVIFSNISSKNNYTFKKGTTFELQNTNYMTMVTFSVVASSDETIVPQSKGGTHNGQVTFGTTPEAANNMQFMLV